MTKTELLEKIAEAYNKLDGLEQDLKNIQNAIGDAISLLEDIPENADEITDNGDKGDG